MKSLSLLVLSTIVLFASCKKDDPTPKPTPTPTTNSPSPVLPSSADGFIGAIKTITSTSSVIGPIETTIGTAVAAFGNLATSTYNDAGAITLNGSALTKNSNNSYVFQPSATSPTGLDFSSNINWSVGNPSFTYNAASGKGMPGTQGLQTVPTEVQKANAYTFTLKSAPVGADSIYYSIADGAGKNVIARTGGNTSTATLSSADMGTLTAGTGILQVTPYNYEVRTLGGKQVVVLNQVTYTYAVEIK